MLLTSLRQSLVNLSQFFRDREMRPTYIESFNEKMTVPVKSELIQSGVDQACQDHAEQVMQIW